jgi:hypothetical protein
LQPNLKTGVYTEGFLHPLKEEGVSFYQDLVRADVFKQFELEKVARRPIYPARARPIRSNEDEIDRQQESNICRAVDEGGRLSW